MLVGGDILVKGFAKTYLSSFSAFG